MRTLLTAAVLAAATITATMAAAGECPADAPEGWSWLSNYVTEFTDTGEISTWFTDSLAAHPDDYALNALNAYFVAEGDVDAARDAFVAAGGNATDFANGLACAGVDAGRIAFCFFGSFKHC